MLKKSFFTLINVFFILIFLSLKQIMAAEVPLPITPTSIACGDLNQDGYQDLAVGIRGDILIYWGNYNGNLSSYKLVAFPGTPTKIIIADINGDNKNDLVISDSENGGIKILVNQGSGDFLIHEERNSPSANDFALGYFNDDSFIDIAVANTSGGVSVLYGNGIWDLKKSTWFTPATYPIPAAGAATAIATADFNQDGRADFAVTAGDMLYILEGQEDGSFGVTTQVQTGSSPVAIGIADFNHDRILDIVVANKSSNSIGLYYGRLEGGKYDLSSPVFYQVGYSPSALSIADFNGDNYLDVAVTCEGDNTLYFLLDTGLGNFSKSIPVTTGIQPVQVIATDLNHNGKMEIITLNKISNSFTLLYDQEINAQLSFRLPSLDIKVSNNGGNPSDGPITVTTEVNNNIQIWASLDANDCHGISADVYLLLNASVDDKGKISHKTYSITSEGLTEGEAPLVTNWTGLTNIPLTCIWTMSVQDLVRTIGAGYYNITAKLVIHSPNGLTYYVSDTADFAITGRVLSNPPTIDVKVQKVIESGKTKIKTFVSVNANKAQDLPAFAYIWIECYGSYTYTTDDNTTEVDHCAYIEQYTPEGWQVLEDKCYTQDEWEDRQSPHIDPCTEWPVTDLDNCPLFDLPVSEFPSGYSCTFNVGLIIQNEGGFDYSVFDSAPF